MGRSERKITELDDPKRSKSEMLAIRALWEQLANAALADAGHTARVDVGRSPDPAPTLGAARTALERRARPRTTNVAIADLVTEGDAVTAEGEALADHTRRRRRERLRRRRVRRAPRPQPVPAQARVEVPSETARAATRATVQIMRATPALETAPPGGAGAARQPRTARRTERVETPRPRTATMTPTQPPRPTRIAVRPRRPDPPKRVQIMRATRALETTPPGGVGAGRQPRTTRRTERVETLRPRTATVTPTQPPRPARIAARPRRPDPPRRVQILRAAPSLRRAPRRAWWEYRSRPRTARRGRGYTYTPFTAAWKQPRARPARATARDTGIDATRPRAVAQPRLALGGWHPPPLPATATVAEQAQRTAAVQIRTADTVRLATPKRLVAVVPAQTVSVHGQAVRAPTAAPALRPDRAALRRSFEWLSRNRKGIAAQVRWRNTTTTGAPSVSGLGRRPLDLPPVKAPTGPSPAPSAAVFGSSPLDTNAHVQAPPPASPPPAAVATRAQAHPVAVIVADRLTGRTPTAPDPEVRVRAIRTELAAAAPTDPRLAALRDNESGLVRIARELAADIDSHQRALWGGTRESPNSPEVIQPAEDAWTTERRRERILHELLAWANQGLATLEKSLEEIAAARATAVARAARKAESATQATPPAKAPTTTPEGPTRPTPAPTPPVAAKPPSAAQGAPGLDHPFAQIAILRLEGSIEVAAEEHERAEAIRWLLAGWDDPRLAGFRHNAAALSIVARRLTHEIDELQERHYGADGNTPRPPPPITSGDDPLPEWRRSWIAGVTQTWAQTTLRGIVRWCATMPDPEAIAAGESTLAVARRAQAQRHAAANSRPTGTPPPIRRITPSRGHER